MMKKIKRVLHWLIINGLACYALYLYGWENNEFAGNGLKFFIIVNFILTAMIFCVEEIRNKIKETGLSVPKQVNFVFGITLSAVLAGLGLFFYASLCMGETIMQMGFYNEK